MRSTNNHILSALEVRDSALLTSCLGRVDLEARAVLFEPGDIVDRVYFPSSAIIADQIVDGRGRATAAAIICNNGFVGLGPCLSGGASLRRQLVLKPGSAVWIDRSSLLAAMRDSEALCDLLGGYSDALLSEALQGTACLGTHTLEERLACCLLKCLDAGEAAGLVVPDDVLASVVGGSPKRVILAARTLQALGLIRYHTGRYDVLDRAGLEELACECYGAVKRKYGRITVPRD